MTQGAIQVEQGISMRAASYFITLQYREMPNFSGPLCPPKVKVAHHYKRFQREDEEMGYIENLLDSRKLKEAEIETS